MYRNCFETYKDFTGKKHYIETKDEKLDEPYWYAVVGYVDGESVLRSSPHFERNLSGAHRNMLTDLERYLDGRHHPSHYRGKLEYLGKALTERKGE